MRVPDEISQIFVGEEPRSAHSGLLRGKVKECGGRKADPPPSNTLKVVSTRYSHNQCDSPDQSSFEPQHTRRGAAAKLIGRKALIPCNLSGLAVTALLDTGAQVSMVSRDWNE